MSPEQASAYDDVDERSDIYSLGAVAYYLLTGQPPFTGTSVLELLNARRYKEVTPPSTTEIHHSTRLGAEHSEVHGEESS